VVIIVIVACVVGVALLAAAGFYILRRNHATPAKAAGDGTLVDEDFHEVRAERV